MHAWWKLCNVALLFPSSGVCDARLFVHGEHICGIFCAWLNFFFSSSPARFATILAFDVKVERDAQELADSLGVKIFRADIIYHLFDMFIAYRDELKARKREEFKHIAVFPCKLKVLPQFIFNSRDPIVMGVMVEAGIIKEGTPLCVPSKEVKTNYKMWD